MASLNKNIQTGNFIPGSEEYTHPEEIAIMGKYLRAGIKELNESLSLGNSETSLSSISNKAQLKNVSELPGENTLEKINDFNSSVSKSLEKVLETLPKEKKEIHLDLDSEKIDISEEKIPSENSFNRSKNYDILPKEKKEISLGNRKEVIESNESGDLEVTNSGLYEKIYQENPRNDKRIIPDSENRNSKFKKLDNLLGGIHYDKYSSETLSESDTPSKDAMEAANSGTSDIIFVRPENLNRSNISSLSEDSSKIEDNKKLKELNSNFSELIKNNNELNLDKEKEVLEKKQEELSLSDEFSELEEKNSIVSLSSFRENFTDKKENVLSKYLEPGVGEDKEVFLSEYIERNEKGDDISLTEIKDLLYEEKRKLALSDYVNKLMEGEITSLEDQRDALPNELKKIVLIDYLSGTIKDERELGLVINSIQEMPREKVNAILDDFVDKLNSELGKIASLNKKYITLGKEKGSENFLKDLYKNMSDLINSNFSENLPGNIKEAALKMGIEKMQEATGTSKEYYNQLANIYEISNLTAEELKKTLDELTNYNGNWGKKVAAYLSVLLGKYKNFKKYIPSEEIEKYKKLVTETFEKSEERNEFIKDKESITKEDLIRRTFDLLKKLMKGRSKEIEKIISNKDISDLINSNMMYGLSIGGQKYGDSISFDGALKNIKTEVIDNTWKSIKGWLTSALNNSLFGAAASLLTEKAKLPGHDYSYDGSIRNIPNVTGFYDKKTTTKSFSGSPHSTPMEISSVDMNTSGWFTRSLSKTQEYVFKDNYLLGEGVKKTLKDLCNTEINQISSVEDLYDVLKRSEKTTAHARTSEGVMNGMTLSSNHVWEITIEPYISGYNGYCTWLPFMQELNRYNYKVHRVRTIYDKWIPITSFELQDKRLINKTLGLYAGEISYPIAMEYSNELRLTIADDSFKSFRYYFDKVAEISTYESAINNKIDYFNAQDDANCAKNRKFNNFSFKKIINETDEVDSTFETIDKGKFAVGMYKNLCFEICIYILTPQYSTIKKYDLLCVMKDYSIEYSGETDASPSDVTVTFSIVGDLEKVDTYLHSEESSFYDPAVQVEIDSKGMVDTEMEKYWNNDDQIIDLNTAKKKKIQPIDIIIEEEEIDEEPIEVLGKAIGGDGSDIYDYTSQPHDTQTRTFFA